MIESTVYFQTSNLRTIVGMFCALPGELKPTHHSLGEDEPGEMILDVGKFLDSLLAPANAGLGPVLKGPNVEYYVEFSYRSIGSERVKSIYCNCYLDVKPELAKQFLMHMATAQPIFGFAGEFQEPIADANGSYVITHNEVRSEYAHRNRHYIKIGMNNIESGIGRDLDKYIPGVYWQTLLSDELLNKHHVDLSSLSVEAISTETLGDGSLHLLKFFERPEDWRQNAERLDSLCERANGVFSRRSVEAAIAGITSYAEYDETIAHWR